MNGPSFPLGRMLFKFPLLSPFPSKREPSLRDWENEWAWVYQALRGIQFRIYHVSSTKDEGIKLGFVAFSLSQNYWHIKSIDKSLPRHTKGIFTIFYNKSTHANKKHMWWAENTSNMKHVVYICANPFPFEKNCEHYVFLYCTLSFIECLILGYAWSIVFIIINF
jgi:hypothetical protein